MDSTERKIIEATIDCIEKHGVKKVTIRLIASESNVNSAAISYYFRSKENLIEFAMKTALENAFEWDASAYSEHADAKSMLKAVLMFLSSGALKFPNLTKAFITDAFLEGDYSGQGIQKINKFAKLLFEKLQKKLPGYSDDRLRMVVHQALAGGVLQFMTLPNAFDEFLGASFTDAESRVQYINDLVDKLFV